VIDGAVVVVTGGGTGVGQALAVEAGRRGARVAIAAPEPANETVERITAGGGEAIWVEVDITDYSMVCAAIPRIVQAFGSLDVLVNNAAGSASPGTLQATDPVVVRRQFEVNILGTYHCLRAFYEPMAASANRGRFAHVLNVGSEHSLGVPPYVPPISTYTVSKYTSLAFTDVLRRDFAAAGIGTTLLAPSWVLTDLVRTATERVPALAESVAGRGQEPELVAKFAWDAVAQRRYVALTNAVSKPFAEAHASELLAAIRDDAIPGPAVSYSTPPERKN
jgi:NAD(P)-dependent dehydrogenase (short-subunit alcohol dehydrogenase family)